MTKQKVITAEGRDMAAGSSDLQVPILHVHGDDPVLYSLKTINKIYLITIFYILNQGESDTALSLILKGQAG